MRCAHRIAHHELGGNDRGPFTNGPYKRISHKLTGGTAPAICVSGAWSPGSGSLRGRPRSLHPAPAAAQIVPMNKTLWLYGVLVFAGGLVGGALTSGVCR